MPEHNTLWFKYTFTLENGQQRAFEVELDSHNLEIIRRANAPAPPDWTRLDFSPCEHCALPPGTTHCPTAVALSEVVDVFRDVVSCKKAEVIVETRERNFYKKGTVQEALFPLLGIYMTASGCPSMEMLKPILRFHLPFASVDETIYRVLTMYVMAQYLRMQDGLEPDWELAGIGKLYDHINKVNVAFCQRLTKAASEDALVNSVVILDMVGSMVKTPTPQSVEKIRRLFEPYLKK